MRLLLLLTTLAACICAVPRPSRSDFGSFAEYRKALIEWVKAEKEERAKEGVL